ncbi:hypothetical protein VTN96DRAFT_3275 [Rasamsonia emersonii]
MTRAWSPQICLRLVQWNAPWMTHGSTWLLCGTAFGSGDLITLFHGQCQHETNKGGQSAEWLQSIIAAGHDVCLQQLKKPLRRASKAWLLHALLLARAGDVGATDRAATCHPCRYTQTTLAFPDFGLILA